MAYAKASVGERNEAMQPPDPSAYLVVQIPSRPARCCQRQPYRRGSDLSGSSRRAVTALVAERAALGVSTERCQAARRKAASEVQAAIGSTGLARRTAPGGDPTTRLNARANAASER